MMKNSHSSRDHHQFDCSWHGIIVNGQDVRELLAAFKEASETKDKPTCVLARTFKGSGLKGIENELDWHGKPLGDKASEFIAHLRGLVQEETLVRPEIPKITAKVSEIKKDKEVKLASPPNYDGKKEVGSNTRRIDRIFVSVHLDRSSIGSWYSFGKVR